MLKYKQTTKNGVMNLLNQVKFLHTADLHLGAAVSSAGSIGAERRQEAILTMESLFALSKDKEIPLVLISGDLLENNSVEPKFFQSFVRCVAENPDITVVFAAGNHDPLTADSPFLNNDLPKNLLVLGTDDECIELNSLPVRIYGRSFGSVYMAGKNNFSLPVPQDDKLNIMVIHGEPGSDLSGGYNTITSDFLAMSGMDYVALGHIHQFLTPQKLGSTYFAYPGTPEPHGFDEDGLKGVILGSLSKESFSFDFYPTARRRYETLEINIGGLKTTLDICSDILSALENRFGQDYSKNFYKIILEGSVSEEVNIDLDEIRTRLSDKVYFVKLRDNTEPELCLDTIKKENTLRGRFVKLMLQKIDAAEEDEKSKLIRALYIGLKAFISGVKYNED